MVFANYFRIKNNVQYEYEYENEKKKQKKERNPLTTKLF